MSMWKCGAWLILLEQSPLRQEYRAPAIAAVKKAASDRAKELKDSGLPTPCGQESNGAWELEVQTRMPRNEPQ